MRTLTIISAGAAAVTLMAPNAEAGQSYDAIKQKGFVQCGVAASGLPGFATVDAQNNWSGLDIDLCRAVAAAVFGDARKVKFTRSMPRSGSPPCNRAKSTCSTATRPRPICVA